MSTPREILDTLRGLGGDVKLVLALGTVLVATVSGFAAERLNPAYGRLTASLEAEKAERIAGDTRIDGTVVNLRSSVDSLRSDANDNSYYLGKLVASRCLDLTPYEQRRLQLPCDLLLTGNALPPAPNRYIRRTP